MKCIICEEEQDPNAIIKISMYGKLICYECRMKLWAITAVAVKDLKEMRRKYGFHEND